MKFSSDEKRILDDNRSGSSEILQQTLHYNKNYLNDPQLDSERLKHLIQFNKTVVEKFNSMILVRNGLNRANDLIKRSVTTKAEAESIKADFNSLMADINQMADRAVINCKVLFDKYPGKIRVATYSNSGIIKKVIEAYKDNIREVILSEARPAYEGREMARFITSLGITVAFVTDMLLLEYLQDATLLLLGADAVGMKSFINKAGSGALLDTARDNEIASAVIFESLKIGDINNLSKPSDNYPGEEVWPDADKSHIKIINKYFEVIQNQKVDYFITDLGTDSPESLEKRANDLLTK